MTAILRGSRQSGYRTTAPIDCPHCSKPISIAGQAAEDKLGPYLALWPVVPVAGEYGERELQHIYAGPKPSAAALGIAPPHRGLRSVELVDDPVPRFDQSEG